MNQQNLSPGNKKMNWFARLKVAQRVLLLIFVGLMLVVTALVTVSVARQTYLISREEDRRFRDDYANFLILEREYEKNALALALSVAQQPDIQAAADLAPE